jgi:hypothetical protein
MIIMAWVLLVCFGLIGLAFMRKFFFGSISGIPSILLFVFSLIISALSAGIIWGKLFQ